MSRPLSDNVAHEAPHRWTSRPAAENNPRRAAMISAVQIALASMERASRNLPEGDHKKMSAALSHMHATISDTVAASVRVALPYPFPAPSEAATSASNSLWLPLPDALTQVIDASPRHDAARNASRMLHQALRCLGADDGAQASVPVPPMSIQRMSTVRSMERAGEQSPNSSTKRAFDLESDPTLASFYRAERLNKEANAHAQQRVRDLLVGRELEVEEDFKLDLAPEGTQCFISEDKRRANTEAVVRLFSPRAPTSKILATLGELNVLMSVPLVHFSRPTITRIRDRTDSEPRGLGDPTREATTRQTQPSVAHKRPRT